MNITCNVLNAHYIRVTQKKTLALAQPLLQELKIKLVNYKQIHANISRFIIKKKQIIFITDAHFLTTSYVLPGYASSGNLTVNVSTASCKIIFCLALLRQAIKCRGLLIYMEYFRSMQVMTLIVLGEMTFVNS